jgi:hypothetical protein
MCLSLQPPVPIRSQCRLRLYAIISGSSKGSGSLVAPFYTTDFSRMCLLLIVCFVTEVLAIFPENTISDGRVHAFRGGAYQAAFHSNFSGILEQSAYSFLGARQQGTCTLPAPWVLCPNGENCCPAEDALCVRSLPLFVLT